ncbi:MAG: hypothetical protein ACRD2L_17270 [Terriglobia bacterium]
MTFSLSFDVEHDYSAADAVRILVPLRHGQDRVSFDADVDTGSTFCIFNRGHAETLGLSVESGNLTRFKTVMGSFDAYGHALTLETLGYSFDVTVYFAAHESFTRNVLGRSGWLDQVRLGIVEYESKLYLSRYGE